MTSSPTVRTATAIADPDSPTHVLRPNAAGEMPVSANLTLDPTNLNLEVTQLLVKTAVQSLAAVLTAGGYETVAASQTAQVLGGAGAAGDYLSGLIVIPATTSPGVVTLLDNAISIPLFVGGSSSVATLIPFWVNVGAVSASGAWKITTGANVSVMAIGKFTA